MPAWLEILTLGASLNPGFARRLTVYPNVVYHRPGKYTLRVPSPRSGVLLGMTGMVGESGLIKGYGSNWRMIRNHTAESVRIDDTVDSDVCMFKADVEGYEAQVMATARTLFATRRVSALQLELTRSDVAAQTCANVQDEHDNARTLRGAVSSCESRACGFPERARVRARRPPPGQAPGLRPYGLSARGAAVT